MMSRLFLKAGKILNRFYDYIGWFVSFLLLASMLVVTYDVCERYIVNKSLTWTTEIMGYLLVYVTFLGSPWVLSIEGGHVAVDVVTKRLGLRTQLMIKQITSVMGAIACAIVTWFAALNTWSLYLSKYYLETTLEIPIFHLHAVIAFGSLLLVVQFIRNGYQYRQEYRRLSVPLPAKSENVKAET
jgi:TRAP-type C4-dicarboxylate transport system permease small subunit